MDPRHKALTSDRARRALAERDITTVHRLLTEAGVAQPTSSWPRSIPGPMSPTAQCWPSAPSKAWPRCAPPARASLAGLVQALDARADSTSRDLAHHARRIGQV
jgi:hypothetical protein